MKSALGARVTPLPGLARPVRHALAARRAPLRRSISVRASAEELYQNAMRDESSAEGLNRYSSTITQPRSHGASQAMLYATGLQEADMNKAQVRPLAAAAPTCGNWSRRGRWGARRSTSSRAT